MSETPDVEVRENKVKILPRHRIVLEELTKPENEGLISKAMIAASYSPSFANVPKQLTESKSWAALMEEQLPESHLAFRHRELLDKRDYKEVVTGRGKNRKVEKIDMGVNTAAVSRAVELGYKLRGRLMVETPTPPPVQNVYNLFYKPEVRANVRAFEDQLKHAIAHEVAEQIDTDDAPLPRTADSADDAAGRDTGDATPDSGRDGADDDTHE